MTQKVKVGIVGSGSIANTHMKSIIEVPNAELVAVYSRNKETVQKLADTYNITPYTDYQDFLTNAGIDMVAIVTPSGTHAELGIAAAKAGKHVVVEKPIDITIDKTNQLIAACKQANVTLSCIFQHRFDEAVQDVKKVLNEGEFGQLNFGAARTTIYRSQEYYDSGAWRGTWELDGGGALINQSIHYIDLLLYVMGPVDEVYAYTATRAHERIEVEDIAVATVKFKSGALGLIEGNTTAYPGFSTTLDIFGTNGSVIIENDNVKEWKFKSGLEYENKQTEMETNVSSNIVKSNQSFVKQYTDVVQAILENREPLVTGEEAKKSLELILAIYQSAREGRPVKL
ncbi:Gfo/Idh/MocA family oxidoreductase [Fredinandcohnia sp. QZ13]|uniref:Gfo/Idh/MocA family protein n=1 Tax=Fredinandcohnia sp. QZ13 TaxID=3073144 RepID=UPI0028532E53|nr:Gfo/Idh/MocA family oxidoreductase [Fredinandcohnia sp. QZ13]MDR4887602.1 Gfo/Idh/MocA family oxidoreductase [Fredinandcohnia sp. QZ13]